MHGYQGNNLIINKLRYGSTVRVRSGSLKFHYMDLIETFLLKLRDILGCPELNLDECIDNYDTDWFDYGEADNLMCEMFPTLNDLEHDSLRDFFWGVITPDVYGVYKDVWKCYEHSRDTVYATNEIETILNKIIGGEHYSNKVSIF